MRSVGLYWEVARATARRMATYRWATVAGVVTNTAFGFILAYGLLATFRGRGPVDGFDSVDAVTYTFVAQGIAMAVGVFGQDLELAERIRTGEVAMDLARPYDYQAWWAAVAYGKAAFYAWARGIPPFVVGALVLETRLPDRWWIWPAFAASVVLAIGVSFALRFLVQLLAFWFTDVRGPNQVVNIAGGFLAGILVPVALFPPGLRTVARALPWASTLDAPISVFLGLRSGSSLVGTLVLQVVWLVVLVRCGRAVLAAAVRRLEVAGG